jgi:hypothetical protein
VKFFCRKMGEPETSRAVEVEEGLEHTAADEYVCAYVRTTSCGVVFVEVAPHDRASATQLWRCEILEPGPPLVLLTEHVTYAAARQELS